MVTAVCQGGGMIFYFLLPRAKPDQDRKDLLLCHFTLQLPHTVPPRPRGGNAATPTPQRLRAPAPAASIGGIAACNATPRPPGTPSPLPLQRRGGTGPAGPSFPPSSPRERAAASGRGGAERGSRRHGTACQYRQRGREQRPPAASAKGQRSVPKQLAGRIVPPHPPD